MKIKVTREETKFLWKSIAHIGAGIYLLCLSLFFIISIFGGKVIYTRDLLTPSDLSLVIFFALSNLAIMYFDYREMK